jgi:DNA mismatch endonuclease (patch repair protein)
MKLGDPGYPMPSSEATSKVMKGNRKTNSKPETLLRSALFACGLRYRKNLALRTPIGIVRPDIVFHRQMVAVFVDGCFWHSCPVHGNQPSTNGTYWRPKLARNRNRDRLVTKTLADEGWSVVRVWEHEAVPEAVRTILEALAGQSSGAGVTSEAGPLPPTAL